MNPKHGRMRGFSLVELLVAMVIALIGTVIIFQVFEVSEGIKRTSTSGGDAQQFGALALFNLERDLRMAGYGINNPTMLGCTVHGYDTQPAAHDLPAFTMAPVIINAAAPTVATTAGTPDSVTLMYGDSALVSTPPKIIQNMVNASSVFKINNRFGFVVNDVVLAAEPGVDCSIAQVSSLPLGADANNIEHSTGRFNKPGGLGIAYTTNGVLFNLGPDPVRRTYSINNGRLVMSSTFGDTTAMPIADNIVSLKVQYGKDTNGNGDVDTWESTMAVAPSATDWSRILVMRLALVARSAQPEIASSGVKGDPCDTTTVAPAWSGGSFNLAADASWQCYRYRVFETTVPLRNLFWQQP